MKTLQEKLASLVNRATLYELAAIKGDQKILIAHCQRKTRRGLFNAISNPNRVEAIKKLTGADAIDFAATSAGGGMMGEWKIIFTGRTQRDAYIAGELPYVDDEIAALIEKGAKLAETPATIAGQVADHCNKLFK